VTQSTGLREFGVHSVCHDMILAEFLFVVAGMVRRRRPDDLRQWNGRPRMHSGAIWMMSANESRDRLSSGERTP